MVYQRFQANNNQGLVQRMDLTKIITSNYKPSQINYVECIIDEGESTVYSLLKEFGEIGRASCRERV